MSSDRLAEELQNPACPLVGGRLPLLNRNYGLPRHATDEEPGCLSVGFEVPCASFFREKVLTVLALELETILSLVPCVHIMSEINTIAVRGGMVGGMKTQYPLECFMQEATQ